MPRKPLGDRPMSNAERQARHRAVRAAALPVIHYRRAVDHRSRARRWHDAVAVLLTLQAEYRAWLQALPDSLQEGATAEALQIIVDLDLDELQAIEPPRGFSPSFVITAFVHVRAWAARPRLRMTKSSA